MALHHHSARVAHRLRFLQLTYSATVLPIFTAVRYMRDTRPAHKSLVYSDRHLYSVYFQRIGGRNVAHTNIHPKQSPASHAFNRSAHVTPLPSRPRPKKEYCRADSSSFRIGVLSICYTHPYAYTSFKMAQSPPSCRRPYQTSRRHPRTYILTSSNSSPRDTHLRIFSRLSTSSLTIAFTLPLPTSTVTPTPMPPSDPPHSVTHLTIFSRLSTSILTFSLSGGALSLKSPLHQHQIPIPSLPYQPYDFFATLYLQFYFPQSGGA